jgi:hypothetical protein
VKRQFSHIVRTVDDRASACGQRDASPVTLIEFAAGDWLDWCPACVDATGLEHLRPIERQPQLDLEVA